MKIDSITVKFYEWDDIQTEICKRMDIDEKYFRDYHKIIGGEYKDLWHEWLRYFYEHVINGHIHPISLGEMIEYKIQWVTEDGKEWLIPFIKAVYSIWDEYDIEYVRYYW